MGNDLLNQFHDILPGTSIKEVYEDSHKDYKKILKAGNEMLEQAVSGIASNVLLEEASIIVFNQLSFDRSDVVEVLLPDEYTNVTVTDGEGNNISVQTIQHAEGKR